jgi:hypothetical protein
MTACGAARNGNAASYGDREVRIMGLRAALAKNGFKNRLVKDIGSRSLSNEPRTPFVKQSFFLK